MSDVPCPCGSNTSYTSCCGPLHLGQRHAATAEALMRSRYAAFARGQVDYLVETLHPSRRGALDRAGLVESARKLRWTGLTITATEAGSIFDTEGVVAFEARYRQGKRDGVLAERSRFVREEGRWYYVDGDPTATLTRGATS